MFDCYGTPMAKACICGDEANPKLRGTVTLHPHRDGTLLQIKLCGLPENELGFFALHIHNGDSCRDSGFPDAGSHYNPGQTMHPVHAGDLPPLLACKGRAYMAVVTDRFQICDVIGKPIIIHSAPDDFRTQPSGNAGTKIACGMIKKQMHL